MVPKWCGLWLLALVLSTLSTTSALSVPMTVPTIPLPPPLCWARSTAPPNGLGISSTADPNQFISITFDTPSAFSSHNLIKACCPKRLPRNSITILDCTLGLGSDAHLLFSAGCSVIGCERDARVHALVSDAFDRLPGADSRMKIFQVSAEDKIREMLEECGGESCDVDTIYIDTMFPKRKKNRPPAKLHMELLRTLLETEDMTGDGEECSELFKLALELAGRGEGGGRVVVKRPKGSEELGGEKKPVTFVVGGKGAVRFDCYEC